MKLPRRKFLHLAAGAAVLPAVPSIASAQTYPMRPVRWIVGFAPGGSADIHARLMAQWLSDRLGQQFVIENRPGAATNIALQAAVNSKADGYTLVSLTSTNASNATSMTRFRSICSATSFRLPVCLEVRSSWR
jgi:tripartite-type tricarboxylate transporter receptor subunit TctC